MKYEMLGAELLGQEPSVSNVKDISATGLKFWSGQFLEEGTALRVSVCLPPLERNITALAKVVRIRQAKTGVYYIAVRFVDIEDQDRADLAEFIDSLSKRKALVPNASIVNRRPKIQYV